MALDIVVRQIAVLAILVIIGLAASRAGVITSATRDLLAKIIFYVTLPSMLLTNFSRIDITPRLLSNSLQVLVISVVVLLFMLSVGWITSRLLGLKGGTAAVFRLHSMLGNIIYLGLPVISALYGNEGLLYGSIFVLVSHIMMWTLGVAIITPDHAFSFRKNARRIFNINTIAIISGFLLFLFSVRMPAIILDSVGALGGTNTYLSMIYIGAVLWFAEGRKMIRNKVIYILSLNRLIIVPLMILGIFILLNHLFPSLTDPGVVSVLVMQAAMPCMVNVVIMVSILGEDDGTATANVFISTVLSVITLPLILFVLSLTGY